MESIGIRITISTPVRFDTAVNVANGNGGFRINDSRY